jgi:hypothetical protein
MPEFSNVWYLGQDRFNNLYWVNIYLLSLSREMKIAYLNKTVIKNGTRSAIRILISSKTP